MSYWGVHETLKRRYGKAREHGCWLCPNQASDWAYLRSAAEPLWDEARGRWYSNDPEDYAPLCRGCHLKLDWDTRHITLWPPQAVELHRQGVQKGGLAHAARMKVDPAYRDQHLAVLRSGAGGRVSGSRQRKCGGCDMVSSRLGRHQKATGHQGWVNV